MRALVYTGPGSLDYREVADAAPRDGERLVRVEAVGICGSDMHAYLGHDERRPAPLVLGHEVAGVLADGGGRVTVNPLVTCGSCPACRSGRDNLCPSRQIISMPPREGGFAEMVALPDRNLVAVPEAFPAEKAALAEPIACGWHAVRLALAAVPEARRALVIGGGAIGLGSALSLAAQGVSDVLMLEPNALRRSFLAQHCGQDVRDPAALGADDRFDIVIDGVGFEATRRQACAAVRPGGTIVHVGLGSAEGGLDVRQMTLQEITFVGTYTYTAEDFRETARAMFDGRLGALDWTEERPLGQGAAAFEDIRAGRTAAPKIVLRPGDPGGSR